VILTRKEDEIRMKTVFHAYVIIMQTDVLSVDARSEKAHFNFYHANVKSQTKTNYL